MNIESTVDIILDAAQVFENKARYLRSVANELNKTKDLSLCGEAIRTITSLQDIRLDLLVNRPIRELEREIERMKNENNKI